MKMIDTPTFLFIAVLGFAAVPVSFYLTADQNRSQKETTSQYVKEIRLSDGTRCAVIDTYSKAAISCDWQRR